MIRIRRPLGCGTALVAALVALACLLARPLGAQMPAPAPPAADSLWEAMGACSGLPIQPGGDLADVKWRYDATRVGDQRRGFAVWLPPDTVVYTPDAPLWQIAHELLHHRLRGPGTMPFPHPLTPFAFPCHVMPWQHGMGTPLGAQQPGVLIDTVAARQLAAIWPRQPGDSLACLYLHREAGTLVIDSAPQLAVACGAPANGMVGFIAGDAHEEAVLHTMGAILARRPDLVFIGEVHAVVPTATASGHWIKVPLIWGAQRLPGDS